MVRIVSTNIPDNKTIRIALSYIYGIGQSGSLSILKTAGIDPSRRARDLSDEELNKIREIIEKKHTVEGELKAQISQNIKRLKNINSYRGIRHSKNLPVRGQRTHTNARTKRGKKITVGSGRKKAAEKT